VTTAFHVVVPSLPGFGVFRQAFQNRVECGAQCKSVGDVDATLGYERGWRKRRLGFRRYARARPSPAPGLIAAHVNWPSYFRRSCREPDHRRRSARSSDRLGFKESKRIFREQATRPQTIGYALADSRCRSSVLGSTRNFRCGLTIAVNPGRRHLNRRDALTILVYIGSQYCSVVCSNILEKHPEWSCKPLSWPHRAADGRVIFPREIFLSAKGMG